MKSFTRNLTRWTAISSAMIAAALSSQVSVNASPVPGAKAVKAASAKTAQAAPRVAAARPVAAKAVTRTAAAKPAAAKPVARTAAATPVSEKAVRSSIKFKTVRWAGKPVKTLDEPSRILLAKAAAEKAGLRDVGLSYRDVYGVINAETGWIPRTGYSKNGTPNLGLAQFEPRTAKGLGVKDPSDPVQAVFGAALYMKEGAEWSARKIENLPLSPEQRAAKLREGVSVYYNLSIKGRNKWDGRNAATLPKETQRHIREAAAGAAEAAQVSRQLNT